MVIVEVVVVFFLFLFDIIRKMSNLDNKTREHRGLRTLNISSNLETKYIRATTMNT